MSEYKMVIEKGAQGKWPFVITIIHGTIIHDGREYLFTATTFNACLLKMIAKIKELEGY